MRHCAAGEGPVLDRGNRGRVLALRQRGSVPHTASRPLADDAGREGRRQVLEGHRLEPRTDSVRKTIDGITKRLGTGEGEAQ
jgi:hypothetical protein